MKSKLYKLAIWYIAKCNAEWNKRKFADDLKSLDRLTYWNFGKYMLVYGADAEWRIFSRYEVLDNAIQKLAKYENEEQEIRNKAIDEAMEASAKAICVGCGYLDEYKCTYKGSNCGVSKPMLESVTKALEQLKGGVE